VPQIIAVDSLTDRRPSGGGRRAGIWQTPLCRSEFGSRLRGIAIVPPRPLRVCGPDKDRSEYAWGHSLRGDNGEAGHQCLR